MKETDQTEITFLQLKHASEFAPLLAAYTQALKRGAPRRPDLYYAESLLQDRVAEVLGARINGKLLAFVIFADMPDPLSGMRRGVVDHIYVDHSFRKQGLARALIDVLSDHAEDRGWSELHLNAPRQPEDGRRLYEQIATPADGSSFVIHFGND